MNKHMTGALLLLLAPIGCSGVPSGAVPPASSAGSAFAPIVATSLRPAGVRAERIYFGGYDATKAASSEIGVFAATATGNTGALQRIVGSNTGLASPGNATRDAQGRIWTCNFGTNTIQAFGPGASGNVAPVVSIGGSKSPVEACAGMALDASGNIYASSFDNNVVAVWKNGSNGNVAPIRTYDGPATELSRPFSIEIFGGRMYVTNGSAVSIFGAVGGNVAPSRYLTGSTTQIDYPTAVAVDPSTYRIVVADEATSRVLVFPELATGNVAPLNIIGGSKTHLVNPYGVAVDGAGYIYVGNCPQTQQPTVGSIAVFAPGATGNVAPVQLIEGSNADISCVDGIAVF